MHTPLYNHIMIIRSELRSASARESTFFVSHPKNVSAANANLFLLHLKNKNKKNKKTQSNNSLATHLTLTQTTRTVLRPSLEKELKESAAAAAALEETTIVLAPLWIAFKTL